jgi:Nif-specific regulatory protein
MEPPQGGAADAARLRRERDLYLRLLELGQQTTLNPFLVDALGLLVEATGAREAYLELFDEAGQAQGPRWWTACGLSGEEITKVRATISRGIIAEAVASGRTVLTPAAFLDPRFSARDSVRVANIQAVLCAPIGSDPPRGILYLTGAAPDQPFSEDHRQCVELVARHLAPLVDRLLVQERLEHVDDPTRPWREMLHLEGFVGRSAAIAAVLREVAIAAPSSKNVLLIGQTGTGKSQLARIIHDNGPRARGPFIEVNCTAIPETLAESELFGAKRTAATGIDRDRVGLVGQADGGTLFLDEIGDMPFTTQGKLLQLLHSKQYTPLGGRPVQADVRIIAGTNADLRQAVADKRFRQDLLYRLDVITIRMPSLAERREDIPEFAAAFCAEACRSEGHAARMLSGDALRAILATEWPGNVRELEHAIERGVLQAGFEGAAQVERRHIFPEVAGTPARPDGPLTFQEATRRFHKRFIEEAVETCDGNVSEAARRIDLSRAHLYDLMRGLGIERRR